MSEEFGTAPTASAFGPRAVVKAGSCFAPSVGRKAPTLIRAHCFCALTPCSPFAQELRLTRAAVSACRGVHPSPEFPEGDPSGPGCYTSLVKHWFQDAFPTTNIEFKNGAIGGSDSSYYAFCGVSYMSESFIGMSDAERWVPPIHPRLVAASRGWSGRVNRTGSPTPSSLRCVEGGGAPLSLDIHTTLF